MAVSPCQALGPLPGQPLLGERELSATREIRHTRRQASVAGDANR